MTHMLPSLLALCGVALISVSDMPVRQTMPTFKGSGATVSVFATVTDAEHRLVPKLSSDDFLILDNGKPQAITAFDNSGVPITIVVLLDDSGSMMSTVGLLHAAAQKFIQQLRPADRAEFGSFNDTVSFARPFTNDEIKLTVALVTLLRAGGGTGLWDALDESINELRGIGGRKVVLVFTDGVNNTGEITRDHVIGRARADNVMVYVVTLETQYVARGKTVRNEPDEGLAKLADETGGGCFALTRSADLNATFIRVADELHSQYLLGFEATKLDGKVHRLDVGTIHPEMRARARRNYVASVAAAQK